jgi:hypothetical protein
MEKETAILDQATTDDGEEEQDQLQEAEPTQQVETKICGEVRIKRQLGSWLAGYEEFTEDFEPPRIFNRWVGLLTLAAATQRRVWLEDANNAIYPNLFVVLVASSGVGKTSAMREALPFIEAALGSKHISPSKITAAQFAKQFGLAQKIDPRLGIYTPYLVWAEEFPSFLGNDAYKSGMIADLTTL